MPLARLGDRGWVADGLNETHNASPNAKIFIVGQFGRPSVAFIKQLVAAVPEQKAALAGDDECTFFLDDGSLNEPGFVKLTAAIDAYEAECERA